MILIENRCASCGGFIEVNENKNIIKCVYCGCSYRVKDTGIQSGKPDCANVIDTFNKLQYNPTKEPDKSIEDKKQLLEEGSGILDENGKVKPAPLNKKLFTWKL